MSKAALWNLDSEDFDARDFDARRSARAAAARRQGASLGEWLNGGVADDVLERDTGATMRTVAPIQNSKTAAHDLILAKAIDAMERRTQSKRRTAESLGPIGPIIERTEANHERVTDLTYRIAEIETRLSGRSAPMEENPVRATLARLETRLDSFGRQHSLAEAVALHQTFAQLPKPDLHSESFQRLEMKLDAILNAIQTRSSEASSIALAVSQAAGRREERWLGDAVGDIARRQQMLDVAGNEPVSLKQAVLRRGIPAPRHVSSDESPSLVAIKSEIAALTTKIEGLCHDIVDQRNSASKADVDLDLLRADIAKMSRTMRDLAPRVSLADTAASICALVGRIDASRDGGISPSALEVLTSAVGDLRDALDRLDVRETVESLSDKIHAIGDKIDDLEQIKVERSVVAGIREQAKEVRGLVAKAAAAPLAVDRINSLIGSLSGLLNTPTQEPDLSEDIAAAADELRDFVANAPSVIIFTRVETGLRALAKALDGAIAGDKSFRSAEASQSKQSEIEGLLRDLGRKMDAVQSPNIDHEALDALQKQIAVLSSRFENADDGLAKLNVLQQSMQGVLTHLEKTRETVETSAAEAAREVLRIAAEKGQGQSTDGSSAESLAKMQAMQEDAEARTGTVLSAVQQTLSKVVDRISSMETDAAVGRETRKPQAAPKAVSAKLSEISLGAPDPLLDQALGAHAGEKSTKVPKPVSRIGIEADGERDRGDFITAARRAAKAAQAEIAVPAMQRADSDRSDNTARANLLEQSRDYVARHKKPVLLGIAALFVIVGTMAIAHRIHPGAGESQTAAVKSPAQIASALKAPAQAKKIGADGDIANKASTKTLPSMAYRTPQARSNQIASVAALPVFASRPPAPPPLPTLPAKLTSMAEAGDAGAAYVLGTQYAEGRAVPRDFKLAARWYQKAAEKGLAPAQYRLASLLEKGLGVEKDKAKARSLYLQAAEAGNPRAMHNLAVLLADGDGKPDYQGAATWFRKAAQYGMQDSQFNLAILLARGLGVQQSLVQSYQWFAIAAAQDDPDAATKRDEVGTKLDAADLAVAKALAGSFHPRAVTVAAVEVQPPPGGWDSAPSASHLNSARPKLSSL